MRTGWSSRCVIFVSLIARYCRPVSRVQMAMHPWVAYGVMPIFALANAGVSLAGADLSAAGRFVMLGTALALIAGKPLGIVGATWVAVKLGWCRLAPGVSWGGVCLVGLLAGIGFTMSIFIAMLAFTDEAALTARQTRRADRLARCRHARHRLGHRLRSTSVNTRGCNRCGALRSSEVTTP
jgi:Na+/H+ antiporter NhaA